MSERKVTMPETDTLEALAVQVWDTLQHYRDTLGSDPYAEARFTHDGTEYVLRITQQEAQ